MSETSALTLDMSKILDLDRYPLDKLNLEEGKVFAEESRQKLQEQGACSLPGFICQDALEKCVSEAQSLLPNSFRQSDHHNVYFTDEHPPVACSHPARQQLFTSKWCAPADLLGHTILNQIYRWPPLAAFVAYMTKNEILYPHADPLACLNLHYFGEGDLLDWHFDRSKFTVTLLLQKPEGGGQFQVRRSLRTEDDPNYDGVGNLLSGNDPDVETRTSEAGTFTVFSGRYAAHRVSPVEGDTQRILATLSYEPEPDVSFKPEDRVQFYGRM